MTSNPKASLRFEPGPLAGEILASRISDGGTVEVGAGKDGSVLDPSDAKKAKAA